MPNRYISETERKAKFSYGKGEKMKVSFDYVLSLFIGVTGFVMLWRESQWIALGVFLLILGNNMEIRRQNNEK